MDFTKKMKVSNIKYNFDVRVEGNNLANVEQMANYLTAGGFLPPVVVNQVGELVEGRQRLEAAKRAGLQEIEVTVKHFNSRVEEITYATICQLGTATPLTPEDIRFNMRQLLKLGKSHDEVVLMFQKQLTRPLADRYASDAASTLFKQRLQSSMDAVASGLSLKASAARNEITVEQLQNALKRKGKQTGKKQNVNTKARFGTSFRTISKKSEALYKALLSDIRDGIVDERSALEIAEHPVNLFRTCLIRSEDYLHRVKQHIVTHRESLPKAKKRRVVAA